MEWFSSIALTYSLMRSRLNTVPGVPGAPGGTRTAWMDHLEPRRSATKWI